MPAYTVQSIALAVIVAWILTPSINRDYSVQSGNPHLQATSQRWFDMGNQ